MYLIKSEYVTDSGSAVSERPILPATPTGDGPLRPDPFVTQCAESCRVGLRRPLAVLETSV
jgi:hypothetical protein